jgi:hypothetical protein
MWVLLNLNAICAACNDFCACTCRCGFRYAAICQGMYVQYVSVEIPVWSQYFKMANAIDVEQPLLDMGMNSMQLTLLVSILRTEAGSNFSIGDLLLLPVIRCLLFYWSLSIQLHWVTTQSSITSISTMLMPKSLSEKHKITPPPVKNSVPSSSFLAVQWHA